MTWLALPVDGVPDTLFELNVVVLKAREARKASSSKCDVNNDLSSSCS
jgi:hypothetical protein